jgi:hypothetical protein
MLKLQANPTFKAKVAIPIPGGDSVPVEFEFKHMTKDALTAFMEKQQTDGGSFDTIAHEVAILFLGVDQAFSKDALTLLLQNYMAAAREIAGAYAHELSKAKSGN